MRERKREREREREREKERETQCVLRNIGSHCGISNGKNKAVDIMFYHFNASIMYLTVTSMTDTIPE